MGQCTYTVHLLVHVIVIRIIFGTVYTVYTFSYMWFGLFWDSVLYCTPSPTCDSDSDYLWDSVLYTVHLLVHVIAILWGQMIPYWQDNLHIPTSGNINVPAPFFCEHCRTVSHIPVLFSPPIFIPPPSYIHLYSV